MALLPDFTGKCDIGRKPVTLRAAPHDCIAIDQELWFERLDFDAF